LIANVNMLAPSFASRGNNLGGCSLSVLCIQVSNDHGSAFTGKSNCDRPPDTATSPCYECNFVFQPKHREPQSDLRYE
jgi:hypothetical protein